VNTATSKIAGGANSVSLALAGSGGAGVMTAGNMLLEAAAQAGYFGLMTRTSGPQIRGGEAAAMLRIATHAVEGPDDRFDALIAVDWLNITRFSAEIPLDARSLLIGDPAQGAVPEALLQSGAQSVSLALKALARHHWPESVPKEERHPKCWYQPITDRHEADLALRFTLGQAVTAAIPPGDVDLFHLHPAVVDGRNFAGHPYRPELGAHQARA